MVKENKNPIKKEKPKKLSFGEFESLHKRKMQDPLSLSPEELELWARYAPQYLDAGGENNKDAQISVSEKASGKHQDTKTVKTANTEMPKPKKTKPKKAKNVINDFSDLANMVNSGNDMEGENDMEGGKEVKGGKEKVQSPEKKVEKMLGRALVDSIEAAKKNVKRTPAEKKDIENSITALAKRKYGFRDSDETYFSNGKLHVVVKAKDGTKTHWIQRANGDFSIKKIEEYTNHGKKTERVTTNYSRKTGMVTQQIRGKEKLSGEEVELSISEFKKSQDSFLSHLDHLINEVKGEKDKHKKLKTFFAFKQKISDVLTMPELGKDTIKILKKRMSLLEREINNTKQEIEKEVKLSEHNESPQHHEEDVVLSAQEQRLLEIDKRMAELEEEIAIIDTYIEETKKEQKIFQEVLKLIDAELKRRETEGVEEKKIDGETVGEEKQIEDSQLILEKYSLGNGFVSDEYFADGNYDLFRQINHDELYIWNLSRNQIVKIKESDGSIENDWVIYTFDKSRGEIICMKKIVDDGEKSQYKRIWVPVEQLLKLNKENNNLTPEDVLVDDIETRVESEKVDENIDGYAEARESVSKIIELNKKIEALEEEKKSKGVLSFSGKRRLQKSIDEMKKQKREYYQSFHKLPKEIADAMREEIKVARERKSEEKEENKEKVKLDLDSSVKAITKKKGFFSGLREKWKLKREEKRLEKIEKWDKKIYKKIMSGDFERSDVSYLYSITPEVLKEVFKHEDKIPRSWHLKKINKDVAAIFVEKMEKGKTLTFEDLKSLDNETIEEFKKSKAYLVFSALEEWNDKLFELLLEKKIFVDFKSKNIQKHLLNKFEELKPFEVFAYKKIYENIPSGLPSLTVSGFLHEMKYYIKDNYFPMPSYHYDTPLHEKIGDITAIYSAGFYQVLKNFDEVKNEDGSFNKDSDKALYKVVRFDGKVIEDDINGTEKADFIIGEAAHEYLETLRKEFEALQKNQENN